MTPQYLNKSNAQFLIIENQRLQSLPFPSSDQLYFISRWCFIFTGIAPHQEVLLQWVDGNWVKYSFPNLLPLQIFFDIFFKFKRQKMQSV